MEETRQTRRHGLVGPVILISLGVLFLLNNMGQLNVTVWEVVLRLWPILLVGLGLDLIIGRRSLLGSVLVVILMVAMLFAGVYWMNTQTLSGTVLPQQSLTQPLQGASSAEVSIRFGSGTLRIGAQSSTQNLISGQVATDQGEQVRQSMTMQGSQAVYTLSSQGVPVISTWWNNQRNKIWSLNLNSSIPMNLDVHAGVSQSTLDLSQLKLTDLTYEMGVGESTITLPASGDVQAHINGGVGNLTVNIPHGMAAQVSVGGWLGNRVVNGSYQQNGDLFTTPGFNTAQNRISLDISGGIGNVHVNFQ